MTFILLWQSISKIVWV